MKSDENFKDRDSLFEIWFKKHYLDLILIFLLFYILLPILAPVFYRFNILYPAKIIYWLYHFLCHQLPYRSWFLFGNQLFYPLSITHMKDILYFEDVFQISPHDYELLSSIVGNSFTGYKLALCQRDIAIYFSLFVFGFIFRLNKGKINKIPLWVWIIFGVLPLGIDGITQLFGSYKILITFSRESTPLFRTVTGILFGILSGWYIFPSMELIISQKNVNRNQK